MATEYKKIKGKDLLLYLGEGDPTMATAICLIKDCTLSIQGEKLETSGPGSYFRTYIYGYIGATLSAEGLVAYNAPMNVVQLQEFLLDRKIISYKFTAFETGGLVYSGQLLIDKVDNSSPDKEYAGFTLDATITGKPGIDKTNTLKTVYLANTSGVRLPGCPNPYPVKIYWYDGAQIGIAFDPVDVINIFNQYPSNTELTLTGFSSGCDFTLSAAWSASFVPDYILASDINEDLALADEYINIIGDGEGNGLAPVENA